jgi:acid phosphatase
VSKVLVIMEENHSQGQVLPSGMPYLQTLASQFGQATQWSDISHPSLPNYLSIVGGSAFGVSSDCAPSECPVSGRSVFSSALAAGKSARVYQESMTANCEASYDGDYDVNHNPWAYFKAEAAVCQAQDVPAGTTTGGALLSDVQSGSLPTVGLLSPNLQHDAHNGTLAQADSWLKGWMPVLMSGPDWQAGRLGIVVTFDEGETTELVPLVMVAPGVHTTVTGALNHYALTRFMAEVAGVAPPEKGASAPDIAPLFGVSVAATTGAAHVPASAPVGASPAPASTASGAVADRYLTDLGDGNTDMTYGFDLADVGPYRSTIDGLPTGVRALVWVGDYDKAACGWQMSDAQLATLLPALRGDPKVAGFYIADEADDAIPPFGHCPGAAGQIAARSALVHSLDPGPFTYELVTEPQHFAVLATATDVMGADPYPCRVNKPCDTTMIPRYIAALAAAKVPHYWGVLQAFGDSEWRYPTASELQAMIDQWRHSNWQGIQVFAWTWAGNKLADHHDLLSVLQQLNANGS